MTGIFGDFRNPTLPGKLALVLVSIAGYWLSVVLAAAVDQDATDWISFPLHHAPGMIFGLLVMGPYVARSPYALRLIAMAVASAVIYYLAVLFVVKGPFSYNTITPYLVAGGTAASLVSATTMLVAPRVWRWMPLLIAAIAGIAGGAMFQWDPLARSEWFALIVPHAAWQALVCVALHLGLRSTSS
jgi:peptidoglycan/LPS O-acetylase OafA/YrhL